MKKCPKCKLEKPLSDFYPDRRRTDGVRRECKECTKLARRIYGKTPRAHECAYIQRRNGGRFSCAKRNARMAQKEWQLTRLEYLALISVGSCFYCGSPLPEAGTALDRIDNSFGYIDGNVVPCCHVCNTVKSDFFSFDEMKEIGLLIRDLLKRRQNAPKLG